ncbi:MAG: Phosphoesterase, PA-phosphatase related protein [Candidatus Magasanikbacteria bacterium GW2011_GWA2_46_17]|uniref:Phosphoesterase, PA-phosphatase related protein n=1 Tax=Candidatus Magasanikbacteria bacterium GW2011_GWA2_46_17 TaxID=1619042 RepID=A0A0G1S269_9BACT|nr:MAG: Phosphoesterase, PA-phosphatase related protein [Candidatus Magasanikbacteria bacterium GW2011_GWA2_46_17]
MSLNTSLFFKINRLVGKNRWLDAFGRAGAEWVVVAMLGWYVASDFIANLPGKRAVFWPLAFLAMGWTVGWFVSLLIGLAVREPRPHITHPESNLLFTPLMSWKSFPSDHSMSAFVMFFLAAIFQIPAYWALLPLALWVGWGRVYAGVHYPIDVLGGLAVAFLSGALCYYLLTQITQIL